MEKALKKEQKKWKRELRRDLRQRRLYHPVLLAVYAFAWRTLYRFCMYGGVRRRVPVLGACGLLFLIYWIWVQAEFLFYQKRSRKQLYTELEIEKNEFRLPDGGRYSFGEVQWYRREKERIALFLKGHRFLWLDMEKLTGKNRELLHHEADPAGTVCPSVLESTRGSGSGPGDSGRMRRRGLERYKV